MKVCIVQKRQAKSPAKNIREVFELLPMAADAGAELIAFQEWFLGTNPPDRIPNKFTNLLSDFAREQNVILVTGNMRIQLDKAGKQFIQVTCVIDPSGEIVLCQYKNHLYRGEQAWYRSGTETVGIQMGDLRVIATSGIDSVDAGVFGRVQSFQPSIWVAQANEHVYDAHTSNYEDVIELMKERSLQLNCPIVVPMMLGRFYGADYTGRSFAVANGQIVESATTDPQLLLVDLDVI